MTPPNAIPAISDADLARLLGLANHTPQAPADLAERILARLPPEYLVTPLPDLRPSRRRRWLRVGIGTAVSLLIGTAVAAGLVQTPALAPYLQPLLARVARLAGATPVPPPAVRPVTTAPAIASVPAPTAPVRIDARLPAPGDLPALPAPPLLAPAMPEAGAASITAPQIPPATGRRLAAVQAARAAIDRPLPAAALRRQEAHAMADGASTLRQTSQGLASPATNRPADERATLPDLASRPEPGSASERPGLAARAAAMIEQRTTDAPTAEAMAALPAGAAVPEAAAGRVEAALPANAAERATALAELRAARAAGTLTAEQAQRLRALQQLRAARGARGTRDAVRRPGN